MECGLIQNPKPAPTLAEMATKKAAAEIDKFIMYLERPESETKPWYADRNLKRVEEKGPKADDRRARDQYVFFSVRLGTRADIQTERFTI